MTRGGRNLVILGVASSFIAITTTSISLALYHSSGDIYLDRSRPGFLPDEEEIEEEENKDNQENYTFSETGTIDAKTLDEYLKQLQSEVKSLEAFKRPFNPDSISDESLGIPSDANDAE